MTTNQHQVLDHGPDSTTLNHLLGIGFVLQGLLTDHPEQVVSDNRQFQNQSIGTKLTRREAFNVHIRLDLAVELFAFGMGMVRIDDGLISPIQIGPPGIDFDIRH